MEVVIIQFYSHPIVRYILQIMVPVIMLKSSIAVMAIGRSVGCVIVKEFRGGIDGGRSDVRKIITAIIRPEIKIILSVMLIKITKVP